MKYDKVIVLSLMILLLLVVAIQPVTADWWNPFTWNDNTFEHNDKWYLEYHSGIQLENFNVEILNLDNGKAKVCLLPKTNLLIDGEVVLQTKAYLRLNNVLTKVVEPSDMETESEQGFITKMCVDVDHLTEDYIKFGEHSTVIKYTNESADIKDNGGNLILESQLNTEDYTYLNGKPHKTLGLGYQITHSFHLKAHDNLTNVLNELELVDMKTKLPIEKEYDVKIRYLENVEIPTYNKTCVWNETNQTDTCTTTQNGSYIITQYAYMDAKYLNYSINLSDGEDLTFSIFMEVKQGDYLDVVPTIAGIEYDFWATVSGDLATDLLVYYEFDDTSNSTVLDSSPNSNHGTMGSSMVYNSSGKIGGGATGLEDNANSYVNMTDLLGAENDLSFSLWFKAKPSSTYQVLYNGNNVDYTVVSAYLKASDGSIVFELDTISKTTTTTSTTGYDDDAWHHLCAVWDGTDMRIYVDGALRNTPASRTGTLLNIASNQYVTYSKRDYDGIGNSYSMAGEVDEFGVWTRALTSTECTNTLWNSGNGIPYAEGGDTTPPVVTLDSPANGTVYNTNSISIDFKCKGSDNVKLDNLTFQLWNATNDSLIYSNTNTDGDNNTLETFPRVVTGGTNYTWNCLAFDNSSNNASATNNNTIIVYSIPDNAPVVTLNTPANNTEYTATSTVTFNCTSYDDINLVNVSLYIDNVLNQTNSSGVNDTDYIFTKTFPDGAYTWSCSAFDNSSQETKPTARNFIIDSENPLVNITSPSEGFIVTQFNQSIDLNWTATDANLDTCWYQLGDECYQETTDSTSSVDGDCGLNYTGNSATDGNWQLSNSRLIDGNFDTYSYASTGTSNLYLNYSLPYGYSEKSLWHVKGLPNETNLTIDGSCFREVENLLEFKVISNIGSKDTTWQCNNGTDWITLAFFDSHTSLSHYIYEESMLWKFGDVVTCNDNTTVINYPTTNPDSLDIFMFVQDIVGNIGNDSVTIFKSTDSPNITITSPIDEYETLDDGDTLYLNWSISNTTVLDDCWYEYDGSNTSVTCTDSSTSFSYSSDVQNITIYSNDTFGNLGNKTKEFEYDMLNTSVNYTSIVTSGSIDNLTLSAKYNSKFTSIALILNYDGTNYTMSTDDTGFIRTYYNELIIPSVTSTTNKSFYYIISLYESAVKTDIVTDTYNQTVNPFLIDNCSNYTTKIMNFYLVDEDTQEEINGTIEYEFYIYTYGTTSLIGQINGSVDYLAGVNNSICLDSLSTQYTLTYQIRHYGNETNYFKKFVNSQRGTISSTNIPIELTLFSLLSARGYAFNVIVVGNLASNTGDSGLLVDTQRQYLPEAQFKSVESSVTNYDGIAISHLVQDEEIYNFIISYNGDVLGSFNNYQVKCANPGIGQCAITLNLADATSTAEDYQDYGNISQTLILNQNTHILYHTFNSLDGTSKAVRSLVLKADSYENTTICDNTGVGTSGTIICVLPLIYQNTSIIVQTFIDGEYVGTNFFSVGLEPDWKGADIIIMLLMFSAIVLLMIGHPVLIIIGSVLGLVLPVVLIAVSSASLSSMVIAVIYYLIGGVIALIVMNKHKT